MQLFHNMWGKKAEKCIQATLDVVIHIHMWWFNRYFDLVFTTSKFCLSPRAHPSFKADHNVHMQECDKSLIVSVLKQMSEWSRIQES